MPHFCFRSFTRGNSMGYVSQFSPDGKLFAIIHVDGKLKIWDTESNVPKQEYVPNLHLSSPCTCFRWVNVVTDPKIRRKSQIMFDDANTTLYIALGTSKGGVEMYSYATGKIEYKLQGDGHAGAVTAICLKDHNILYTSGEDCRIVVWSLSKGRQIHAWNIGNEKPTCIVSLPQSNRLLVGCKELKLWSTDTYELLYTFTGHTSEVNSMNTLLVNGKSRAHEFVLSTAKLDREISLWQMKANSNYKNAKATFLIEDRPMFVNCSINNDGEIRIAAVTYSGVVHLFIVQDATVAGGYHKPIKPTVTILLASDSKPTPIPIDILAATSNFSAKNSQNILIGYGDPQFLRFENIKYNPDKKKETLVREDPKKQFSGPGKTKEFLKTITPIIDDVNTEYQTGSTATRKRNNNNEIKEMPMEIRLENLNLSEIPKSKSLAQLLTQALHSHNADLLKHVFMTKDENVIRLTLQRLPPQYIADLVYELTMLTQKKTTNVIIAVSWLKILLQTHASQLMALGTNELFSRFGPLLGIVETRTEVLRPLSKLSGRLELLMCQIKRNTADDDDAIFNHENVLVYEDKDSSDESDFEVRNGGHNSSDEEEEEDGGEYDEDEGKMDES